MTEIRESSSFLLGISMKDALFLDAQVIQGGGVQIEDSSLDLKLMCSTVALANLN